MRKNKKKLSNLIFQNMFNPKKLLLSISFSILMHQKAKNRWQKVKLHNNYLGNKRKMMKKSTKNQKILLFSRHLPNQLSYNNPNLQLNKLLITIFFRYSAKNKKNQRQNLDQGTAIHKSSSSKTFSTMIGYKNHRFNQFYPKNSSKTTNSSTTFYQV